MHKARREKGRDPMTQIEPFKVLFLCTGNSARSIFGEFLLRKIGRGAFVTWSAGAQPRGEVSPYTQRVLREVYKIDPSSARSKSIADFVGTPFDYVITVCDRARETCPPWPDKTVVAHWSSPDPAEFRGTDDETYRYYQTVAAQIQRRIELMCCLPLSSHDQGRRERLAREIGEKEKLPEQT
ncbi:MAG: arsenate reductase ArsC [Opitutaceae bacterium]